MAFEGDNAKELVGCFCHEGLSRISWQRSIVSRLLHRHSRRQMHVSKLEVEQASPSGQGYQSHSQRCLMTCSN